jgi:hypothetical protein
MPWSLELIERYENKWGWGFYERLSENTTLPWSSDLIERYVEHWDWLKLSENTALPWSLTLIDSFADHWRWSWLAENKALRLPLLHRTDIVEIMAYHFSNDYPNKRPEDVFKPMVSL